MGLDKRRIWGRVGRAKRVAASTGFGVWALFHEFRVLFLSDVQNQYPWEDFCSENFVGWLFVFFSFPCVYVCIGVYDFVHVLVNRAIYTSVVFSLVICCFPNFDYSII